MSRRLIAKIAASLILVVAAAVLAVVAVALGRAPEREQALAAAAFAGSSHPVPGGLAASGERWSGLSPSGMYLQALAAERAAAQINPSKHQGESNAAFAAADAAARAALAVRQPAERRSQLLNLLAVDLLGEANADFGNETQLHNRAAWNLQLAVLVDPANNDAKYNLEVLLKQDPQSTRKQPRSSSNGAGRHKPQQGKTGQGKRGADKTLGNGY